MNLQQLLKWFWVLAAPFWLSIITVQNGALDKLDKNEEADDDADDHGVVDWTYEAIQLRLQRGSNRQISEIPPLHG